MVLTDELNAQSPPDEECKRGCDSLRHHLHHVAHALNRPLRRVEQVGAYSKVHARRNDLLLYIVLARLQHPASNYVCRIGEFEQYQTKACSGAAQRSAPVVICSNLLQMHKTSYSRGTCVVEYR